MNSSKNLYLSIIIILIIILVLDLLLSKVHFKLERFVGEPEMSDNNKNTINKKIILDDNNTNLSNSSNDTNYSPSNSNTIKMNELDNTEIKIDNFYPNNPNNNQMSITQLLDNTFELNLFHQIIPTLDDEYLGIVWYNQKINGIYVSDKLKSKEWERLDNDIPPEMLRPIFITYDQDRKLLGIFEEIPKSNYKSIRKYHLFKKKEEEITSEWEFIENTRISSIIYDSDGILIGLDERGEIYKKEAKNLDSNWKRLRLKNNIPMRKLFFDYRNDYMYGLGTDFRIYKKKDLNWLNSEWDTINGPSKKTLSGTLKDLFYDYDGKIVGLSRIGLVKQETEYYLSDFKLYEDEPQKNISIYKILYGLTGIKTMANMNLNNNRNNVYVDGKKISEYEFKDPRLNNYLKHRIDLKKKCRKLKAMKISQGNQTEMVDDDVRNERFIRVLDEQKDVIDNLYDTISDLRNN